MDPMRYSLDNFAKELRASYPGYRIEQVAWGNMEPEFDVVIGHEKCGFLGLGSKPVIEKVRVKLTEPTKHSLTVTDFGSITKHCWASYLGIDHYYKIVAWSFLWRGIDAW